MRVMVVGAAGRLGQVMAARLSREHDVTTGTRADVDITHHAALLDFVRRARPEAIVNCASYNDVDGAERDQRRAFDVNAFAVRTLARAAEELDAVLLHYSTDFVFSGSAATAYTEEAAPEPQSVYAQSKLVGEWMAADWRRHYLVRVESLFGGAVSGSVDRIVNAVRAGAEAPVFFDRVVSPSYIDDVVGATAHMLRTAVPFGLYHCVNSGQATWLELAQEIARVLDRPDAPLKPVSVDEVKLVAARPKFAALSNQKLAAAGYPMPSWQDAIGRHLHGRAAS
ncbi:MAG: dTDP-4-dehydrorhamnose reductase [Vicinamibacterales bacterium]|jgi:dTDP-4-dehydrorhamnose reductase